MLRHSLAQLGMLVIPTIHRNPSDFTASLVKLDAASAHNHWQVAVELAPPAPNLNCSENLFTSPVTRVVRYTGIVLHSGTVLQQTTIMISVDSSDDLEGRETCAFAVKRATCAET